MSEATTKPRKGISRRTFLISAGLGSAGIMLGVQFGVPAAHLKLAESLDGAAGPEFTLKAPPDAWFEFNPDNSVMLYVPKAEMGQGIHTALGQIAAEELGIDWEQISVIHADTGQGLDDSTGTQASSSVARVYQPLREAAASVREALIGEAAVQFGTDAAGLTVKSGMVSTSDGQQSKTYWELVQAISEWKFAEPPPALKDNNTFEIIGQPKKRVDLKAKILGQATYGYDVRVPDMLYGAVLRPSMIGATLASISEGSAAAMPGVVKVVIDKDFVGIVAQTREQAYAALEGLEVEWNTEVVWQQVDIEDLITVGKGKGVTVQEMGNATTALQASTGVIEAEYRTPMGFHAHLEPHAATADVRPDSVHVWTSTQGAVILRNAIARALDRDAATVVVTPTYLGGGFGHKIGTKVGLEAARLSEAAQKPVHVGWKREEDFREGFVRPPTHHRLKAVLEGGRIAAIEHQQASGEVAFAFFPDFLEVIMGADFAAWRGAAIHYDVPNRRAVAWLNKLPVPTGWWRGLGLMANVFAVESFMDELAAAASADPIQFRIDQLPQDAGGVRMRAVLESVRDRSGWGKKLPGGRGLGTAAYLDVGTAVAHVVQVAVDGKSIRVERVTTAVDPGLVINPDGAEAQIQGAIIMGLSATLIEEATITNGAFTASNFSSYPLFTHRMAPEIDIELLEGDDKPHGMGEPPIGPIAAAVANAVFAATGQRLRRFPLKLG